MIIDKLRNEVNISRPIRILQVVGAMNFGGIETWLMQVLRRLDRKRFIMELVYHTTDKCAYDDEIQFLKYRIIPCYGIANPILYAKNFLNILYKSGPYDIVHSQLGHLGGLHMRLAYIANVPGRIMHSRAPWKTIPPSFFQRLYRPILKKWITRYSTHLLATNRETAVGLYGREVLNDPRYRILTSAIDLEPFHILPNKNELRKSLGIKLNGPVIGHIGRFTEAKNHDFFLEIAAYLAKKSPQMQFLLVGDGPLKKPMEEKSKRLGLSEKVFFLGTRTDVPQLLMGAMDLLLFPSRWEGSARVLVEAQAAGLPCVISDVISEESVVIKTLVRRVPLTAPPKVWAEAVLFMLNEEKPIKQKEALAMVKSSPFNIEKNVHELEQIYIDCFNKSKK